MPNSNLSLMAWFKCLPVCSSWKRSGQVTKWLKRALTVLQVFVKVIHSRCFENLLPYFTSCLSKRVLPSKVIALFVQMSLPLWKRSCSSKFWKFCTQCRNESIDCRFSWRCFGRASRRGNVDRCCESSESGEGFKKKIGRIIYRNFENPIMLRFAHFPLSFT